MDSKGSERSLPPVYKQIGFYIIIGLILTLLITVAILNDGDDFCNELKHTLGEQKKGLIFDCDMKYKYL